VHDALNLSEDGRLRDARAPQKYTQQTDQSSAHKDLRLEFL
jgi:hypothetical protein